MFHSGYFPIRFIVVHPNLSQEHCTFSELSVFDLVGDDHKTTNLKECSPSEPHMAFSVTGIGNLKLPCVPR